MNEQTNVTMNDQALIVNFPPVIESNEGIKNYKILMRNGTVGGDPVVKLEVQNEDEEPVTVNDIQYSIVEGGTAGQLLPVSGEYPLDMSGFFEEAVEENANLLEGEEAVTIMFLLEIDGGDETVEFEITAENDFSQAA